MNRLVVAPLVFFHKDFRDQQFPTVITFQGGYELKPLNVSLLDPVFNFFYRAFSEEEKDLLRRCTHALYYEFTAPEGDNNLPGNIVLDIYRITEAMRLVIRTRAVPAILMLRQHANGQFNNVDGMAYKGIEGIEISYIDVDDRMEHFNAQDIPDIQRYWTATKALWETHGGQYNRVLNALIFFGLAHRTREYKPRLANLVTSMESLFNTSKDQVTYVIKQRCAYFLEQDPIQRMALASSIKDIYNLRSLFIHGQTAPNSFLRNEAKQKSLLMETEDIVRRCIRKIFDRNLETIFTNDNNLNREFSTLELGATSLLS